MAASSQGHDRGAVELGRASNIESSIDPLNLGLPAIMTMDDVAAKRVNDKIDEEIRIEKEAIRKRKSQRPEVKVMLLGQSDSGKSTLQKQFQLYYASKTIDRERLSWRPVVYLNLVRAVRGILEDVEWEFGQAGIAYGSRLRTTGSSPHPSTSAFDQVHYGPDTRIIHENDFPSHLGHGDDDDDAEDAEDDGSDPFAVNARTWRTEIAGLRMQLLPLVALEDTLAAHLSGGVSFASHTGPKALAGGGRGVYVRSGWQALIGNPSGGATGVGSGVGRNAGGRDGAAGNSALKDLLDVSARLLFSARSDVEELWGHPAVQFLVRTRKVKLDDCAAFFLENIHRIAQPGFTPANEDILNVRLQTLGVASHSLNIKVAGEEVNWLMYDVGGARGQRHAWVPFFDDATAIIFLAPISAFDQYLEEDPRMNRIDDSLQLFTAICSNKLLKNTSLVLMLNKTDILRQKLDAGFKVRKFITSYGDRPNNFLEVSEYFRAHFLQVHRRNDVSKRILYTHFTSMLNIVDTQKIIVNVGEVIIRQYIKESGLT